MDIKNHKALNSPKQIADFLCLPLSINLAACKDKRHPSVTRCLAGRFNESTLELCLYVSEISSKKLLDDIKTHPKLAAVFCLPSTEQTIQIKCLVDHLRPIDDTEQQFIAEARRCFAAEVAHFGFDTEFVDHYLYAENPIAIIAKAVEFYDQTPGPLAGSILKSQP